METVRFKPGTRLHTLKHRMLCGARDPVGRQLCRGELGLLFARQQGSFLFLHPLVHSAIARDADGAYRLQRQRRPFRSGQEGSRPLGAGVAPAADTHLLRDAQGEPLKWLEPLCDMAGHDELIIVCPRCQAAHAVTFAAFVAYVSTC
jgi:hypothetical protein